MSTVSVVTYEELQLLTTFLNTSAEKYVGWGTSATGAVRTATALGTETYSTTNDGSHNTRPAGTQSVTTTSQTNDTYNIAATLHVASGTGAITVTESAVFDALGTAANLTTAPSGGNMSLLSTFTGFALNVGDGITFTHSQQFT